MPHLVKVSSANIASTAILASSSSSCLGSLGATATVTFLYVVAPQQSNRIEQILHPINERKISAFRELSSRLVLSDVRLPIL
jgi:hypothetical protein